MKIDVSPICNWWDYQTKDWHHGDKVIRKGFLLFPKTVNKEMRWLEKASWEEEWIHENFRGSDGYHYYREYWRKNKWV